MLAGGDFYSLPGPLQFLYPPFAALLAVPLASASPGWSPAGRGRTLMIVAIMLGSGCRAGRRLWPRPPRCTRRADEPDPRLRPASVSRRSPWWSDLAPGPRALPGRRHLPEGALTADAAAVKLTPAIFVVYLLAVGKRRAAAWPSSPGPRDPGQRGRAAAGARWTSGPDWPAATRAWVTASSTSRTSPSSPTWSGPSGWPCTPPRSGYCFGRGGRRWASGLPCCGMGWARSGWRSPCAGWPGCWPHRCPGCTTSSGWCPWPSASSS